MARTADLGNTEGFFFTVLTVNAAQKGKGFPLGSLQLVDESDERKRDACDPTIRHRDEREKTTKMAVTRA